MIVRRLPILLLSLVAACGREERVTAPTAGPMPVEVVADGDVVARLTAGELDGRRCLPEVLPETARDPAAWVMLEARATDGRRLAVRRPAEAYPNQDFCLYRAAGGEPAFGIYRRDDPSLHPRLRELRWQPAPYLVGVAQVSVRTVATPEEAAAGTLTVVLPDRRRVAITPGMLAALPAVMAPETGGGAGGGAHAEKRSAAWRLRDVLALAVDPDTVAAVRIVNVEGERRDLEREDLASGARTILLKRNRRGDHHLRTVEAGRVLAQFRRVVRIEVP